MRPLRRPAEEARNRWLNLSATKEAKKDIEDLARLGPLPSKAFEGRSAWTETIWADALANAQDSQCIWCTQKPIDGGHTGVIDHIRPRSEVTRAVEDIGSEVGHRFRAEDRRLLPRDPLRPGYYWRAYDPENLAYSCERCNTGWKRTLWPVKPWRDSQAWKAPDPGIPEQELILDPFSEGFNPLRHFRFGPLGAIVPRENDEKADVSINTVALDRPGLCEVRRRTFDDLNADVRFAKRILEARGLPAEERQIFFRFASRCSWGTPHAAFYRVALRRRFSDIGVEWSQLQAEWSALGVGSDILEPPEDGWVE